MQYQSKILNKKDILDTKDILDKRFFPKFVN